MQHADFDCTVRHKNGKLEKKEVRNDVCFAKITYGNAGTDRKLESMRYYVARRKGVTNAQVNQFLDILEPMFPQFSGISASSLFNEGYDVHINNPAHHEHLALCLLRYWQEVPQVPHSILRFMDEIEQYVKIERPDVFFLTVLPSFHKRVFSVSGDERPQEIMTPFHKLWTDIVDLERLIQYKPLQNVPKYKDLKGVGAHGKEARQTLYGPETFGEGWLAKYKLKRDLTGSLEGSDSILEWVKIYNQRVNDLLVSLND